MNWLKIILSPSYFLSIFPKSASQCSYYPSVGGGTKGGEFRQEERQDVQAQIRGRSWSLEGEAVLGGDKSYPQGNTPKAGYKRRNAVGGQSEGMELRTEPGVGSYR